MDHKGKIISYIRFWKCSTVLAVKYSLPAPFPMRERDGPYCASRENRLELIELSSINKAM